MQYPPPYHDCPLARTLGTYAFWTWEPSGMLIPTELATERSALAFIRERYPGSAFCLGAMRWFIPHWDRENHVVMAVMEPQTRAAHGFLAGGYCPPGTVIPPGHGDLCIPFDRSAWPAFEVALSPEN
jgi:hypothetical protein